MPASIGVNLRVTGHCSQGGRKYMEDLFSVAYQQTEDERDLEYAFFGIYDGHGGSEAAAFAKEHLMDSIVKQRQFWSDNDEDVLKAIRNGYMLTHLNMWKELEKWPKTVTGLPSTAGTTASIAFIRRGKIYIGHVGDSAIVLGYQKDGCEEWAAKPLTSDHKPESTAEIERIQRCGGKVVSKAGVPRVVWNRPRLGHKGPIKKNTPMDEIPFLAVARSLGDLWSYNPQNDEFIVSPDPDVGVLTIDPSKFRCLIFGTDGLWNMISPEGAVSLVQATERHNEAALVGGNTNQPRDWLNPSKSLVDHALERWSNTRMRADNTSVVTLMLDPPGPPRATVLRSRTQRPAALPAPAPAPAVARPAEDKPVPQNGLTIMTRYSDAERPAPDPAPAPPARPPAPADAPATYGDPAESRFVARALGRSRVVNTLGHVYDEIVRPPDPGPPATALPDPAPAADPAPPTDPAPDPGPDDAPGDDVGIQINEVSSSSPADAPPRARPRRAAPPAPANDRVLRSHHDEPARPVTRQAARPRAPPALERVVILTRRPPAPDDERRATRSQAAPARAPRPACARPGNSARAPGPRRAPAARQQRPRADRSKENLGASRARTRAASAAPEPQPAPAPAPEVHSTTGEACAPAPAPRPRALRSRNEAASPPPGKRARPGPAPVAERCARALGKRASGPWAPALALRNRLRRRLAK